MDLVCNRNGEFDCDSRKQSSQRRKMLSKRLDKMLGLVDCGPNNESRPNLSKLAREGSKGFKVVENVGDTWRKLKRWIEAAV
jgi:hypothetical protein